jgi:hypothetical protein
MPSDSRCASILAGLPPGRFAMVMATGIVSVAAGTEGLALLSAVLLALSGATYALLTTLTALRLAWVPMLVRDDLARTPGAFDAFTFVAATSVLGVRLLIAGWNGLAATLDVVAFLAWLVLGGLVWRAATRGGNGGGTAPAATGGNRLLTVVATSRLSCSGPR